MSVDALVGNAKFVAQTAETTPATTPPAVTSDDPGAETYLHLPKPMGISSPVHAEAPVRAMEFGPIAKRGLAKLGRDEKSLLAEGKVSANGIDVDAGNLPNALALFKMMVGSELGPLKSPLETFEKELEATNHIAQPLVERALFKAVVRFGEDAKRILDMMAGGFVDPPSAGFAHALSGLVDQLGKIAATMNEQGRLSQTELNSQAGRAEKAAVTTAHMIMTVNGGPLSKQLHDGALSENVQELLSEHGFFLKHDTGILCDAAGNELSDADIDALGDQLVTWATDSLAIEEGRLAEAERTNLGGLNDQELDTYAELRADYEQMKQGIPPRTQREALSQAYLKVTAEYGPDAIDVAFLDRLYSPAGVKDDGTLSPAQAEFIGQLGSYATLSNGAFHLSANPEARNFIKKAITLVKEPSSLAAASLMTTFFKTVKAFTDVVKVATSLGRDPFAAIARALPNPFAGLPIGKLGRSRRAERLKGAAIVVKKAAPKPAGMKATTTMPAATPTLGTRTMPLTVGPLGPSAKASGHALWNRIFDGRQDDLRDANKRMIKARLSAIRQEILTKQETYDLSVKAAAAKVHAEKAAK
jgi:hypothetical protein